MKKILSILLIASLLLSFVVPAFAASSDDVTLKHILTCNGQSIYTAVPGEEITVVLTLKSSDGNPFDIKNIQSEVAYDTDLFELADDTDVTIAPASAKNEWIATEDKHYSYRVFACRAIFPNTQEGLLHCAETQVIAQYTLKVKDTAKNGDSGFVKSLVGRDVNVYGPDLEAYGESASDLTVVIGAPAVTHTITYMNGNNEFSTVDVSDKATIINAPSPENGLVFLGWEDENGKLWQPGENYTPNADTTFTAKWSVPIKHYTLEFNSNGGSAIDSLSKPAGTVIALSQYITTRSGYSFGGWYSDASLSNRVTSITLNENNTVYAKWEATTQPPTTGGGGPAVTMHTIHFETLGGSVISSSEKIENTTVDLSKYIPTKSGFVFAGWYLDPSLTEKVETIKITKDVTLYAKWIESDENIEVKPNYKPDILTDDHYAYIMGREDGMIHPQANLTRAEAATIFFRLLDEDVRAEAITKTNSFDDVNDSDWFNTSVSTLTHLGILNGRNEKSFAPQSSITRAELTTIVARLSDADYNGSPLFSDINVHWAKEYINTAASIGWVNGNNGLFRPDDNITRAEVMTLINRVLNRQPESETDLLPDMIAWKDNSDKSAWYYLAVCEATNSHDFEMKEDGIHERWTRLTPSPDWSSLEK